MKTYPFYLVNVFAESHFGGNPLAVFWQADGLTDDDMQKIAQQFNLSETVFIFKPSDTKTVADLRIFTPTHEMAFAGHPTLGACFVLKQLQALPDNFLVKTLAKSVLVDVKDNHVAFTIKGDEIYPEKHLADLANVCRLTIADIADGFYVNAGTVQLLVKLNSHQALQQVSINLPVLKTLYQNNPFVCDEPSIYLWYEEGERVFARMFFEQNGVAEDSGTGSACANLGAYFIHHHRYPITKTIHQGDDMGRPNRLSLAVDGNGQILVGGRVIVVGRGEFDVPLIKSF